MGTTNSRLQRAPRSPPPVPVALSPLDDDDAWDIAIAWLKHLRGYLRLTPEIGSETRGHWTDAFSIVKHFEWIEIDLARVHYSDLKDAVRAVRAAVVAWFALSCCPGFSSHENPVFWKRVFSAYDVQLVVTSRFGDERDRFFVHSDRPFPRLRLVWFSTLQLELLWEAPSRRERHDRTLLNVLRRLEPFIEPSRWTRLLPVGVVVHHDAWAFVDWQKNTKLPKPTHLSMPELEITTVWAEWSDRQRLLQAVSTRMHPQMLFEMNTEPWMLDAADVAPKCLLKHSDGVLDPNSRTETVDLWFNAVPNQVNMFSSWCSALPHLRSFSGIRAAVRIGQEMDSDFTPAMAGWLGYAIFHPARSSFTILTLRISLHHKRIVRTLQRMATGNNLLRAMSYSVPRNGAYSHAHVRAGTIVRPEPERAARPELFVFPSDAWITLAGTVPNLNESVLVVLPGHGLGWIRGSDILSVESQRPASSCVRQLRLELTNQLRTRQSGSVLSNVTSIVSNTLSVLGDRLRILHIEPMNIGLLDARTVQSILRACPRLTSLCIPHDGSCWADASVAFGKLRLPRLRDLELQIQDQLVPLVAPDLKSLRVLRITCLRRRVFRANKETILAVLARYPGITYFSWGTSIVSSDYETQALHDLSGCNEAHVPLKPAVWAAFLSVVGHHQRQSSVMSQLPQDAIRVIFHLCARIVPRQLHIRDL